MGQNGMGLRRPAEQQTMRLATLERFAINGSPCTEVGSCHSVLTNKKPNRLKNQQVFLDRREERARGSAAVAEEIDGRLSWSHSSREQKPPQEPELHRTVHVRYQTADPENAKQDKYFKNDIHPGISFSNHRKSKLQGKSPERSQRGKAFF